MNEPTEHPALVAENQALARGDHAEVRRLLGDPSSTEDSQRAALRAKVAIDPAAAIVLAGCALLLAWAFFEYARVL
jgi:hypothetical protein